MMLAREQLQPGQAEVGRLAAADARIEPCAGVSFIGRVGEERRAQQTSRECNVGGS